jgi:hypothetical protein
MKSKILFFLILGLIILGLAGYGYFIATSARQAQNNLPKIEIAPKFFDFGSVEQGRILEQSFVIKNSGKGILKIKRIAASCACTSAEAAKKVLNPGEKTLLSVRYDTGAMSGPHGKGKQERIVYIQSNDPLNPQTEVRITAMVR